MKSKILVGIIAVAVIACTLTPAQAQSRPRKETFTVLTVNATNAVQASQASEQIFGYIDQINIQVPSGSTQAVSVVRDDGLVLFTATGLTATNTTITPRARATDAAGGNFTNLLISATLGTGTVSVAGTPGEKIPVSGSVTLNASAANAVSNRITATIFYHPED